MEPLLFQESPSSPPSRRRIGGVLAAGGLAAALIAAPLAAGPFAVDAAAAAVTFNPFDVNNGFSLFVAGDVVLGNGEIEGSIAVDGSISSTNQNGYPVVHQVAGLPDYTVPEIDGVPDRKSVV